MRDLYVQEYVAKARGDSALSSAQCWVSMHVAVDAQLCFVFDLIRAFVCERPGQLCARFWA